jgi:chemotaxis protein CheX
MTAEGEPATPHTAGQSVLHAEALARVVESAARVLFSIEPRLVEQRCEVRREAPFEVSGIIGITGPARGSIVMSFPRQLARRLTARMVGSSDPDACSEQDVSDCIGEFANIVAGNLLPVLERDDGGEPSISLPSVVVGPHRVVWSRKDTPCELLRFETQLGDFAAEINLRRQPAKS